MRTQNAAHYMTRSSFLQMHKKMTNQTCHLSKIFIKYVFILDQKPKNQKYCIPIKFYKH